jgi:hypothetical protein
METNTIPSHSLTGSHHRDRVGYMTTPQISRRIQDHTIETAPDTRPHHRDRDGYMTTP